MKLQILVALMISLTLFSCDLRRSKNKDITTSKDVTTGKNLTTGIIKKPEGLSCDEVWLSIDEEKTDRITFIYGEAFSMNFNNMEGLNKVDETVFPGMLLKVTDEGGDTIMQTEDMYADSVNGMNFSPLLLKANFAVVKPIRSNHKYSLFIKIWDKLGAGNFIVEMPFSVIQNERINIETNYITYDEIYLLSADRNKVITDGIIYFEETIYLMFEGLSGFYEKNGRVFPGSKVRAVDYSNTPIMSYDDLYYLYTKTGINSDDFKSQIFVKMKLNEGAVNNPILFETTLFDKKRYAATIKVTTEFNVK
jgi:hypothetical protein